MKERPFRILGVQQVAIGGLDAEVLRAFWVDLLGLPPVGSFRSAAHNVVEDILRVGEGAQAVELDLMTPVDPEAKPAVHTPPLHHVGFWVDDLHAAAAWLQEAGVRMVAGGIQVGAGGHEVCFLHPKGSEDAPIGATGVLVELVQATPEILEAQGS